MIYFGGTIGLKMLSASYLNSKIEVPDFKLTNCDPNAKRPSALTSKSYLQMITMTLVTRKITEHIYETNNIKILNNVI